MSQIGMILINLKAGFAFNLLKQSLFAGAVATREKQAQQLHWMSERQKTFFPAFV